MPSPQNTPVLTLSARDAYLPVPPQQDKSASSGWRGGNWDCEQAGVAPVIPLPIFFAQYRIISVHLIFQTPFTAVMLLQFHDALDVTCR